MISLAWYQRPNLVIMKMTGKPTDLEVVQATEILYEWFDKAETDLVHLIVDQRELEQLPSIKALTQSRVSPRRGWIILLSPPNKALSFASSVASQVLQMKVKFVHTMPEAIQILQKFVANLADLQEVPEIAWEEQLGV